MYWPISLKHLPLYYEQEEFCTLAFTVLLDLYVCMSQMQTKQKESGFINLHNKNPTDFNLDNKSHTSTTVETVQFESGTFLITFK
jgi:hypothetical protein